MEEDETLAAEGHDVLRAGARLLGMDMGRILGGKGATLLNGMITAELDGTPSRRLLNVALKPMATEEDYTQLSEQLRAVIRGLTLKK